MAKAKNVLTPSFIIAKAGKDTTEYQRTKSASVQMYITLFLAVALTYLPQIVTWLPEGSKVTAIVAAIIATLGIIQKLLVDLGYIKSRTILKKEK